jgi:hypothetical protein
VPGDRDRGAFFRIDALDEHGMPHLRRYANLNLSEPSFSIVLTISSPAFNHTCLSLG